MLFVCDPFSVGSGPVAVRIFAVLIFSDRDLIDGCHDGPSALPQGMATRACGSATPQTPGWPGTTETVVWCLYQPRLEFLSASECDFEKGYFLFFFV